MGFLSRFLVVFLIFSPWLSADFFQDLQQSSSTCVSPAVSQPEKMTGLSATTAIITSSAADNEFCTMELDLSAMSEKQLQILDILEKHQIPLNPLELLKMKNEMGFFFAGKEYEVMKELQEKGLISAEEMKEMNLTGFIQYTFSPGIIGELFAACTLIEEIDDALYVHNIQLRQAPGSPSAPTAAPKVTERLKAALSTEERVSQSSPHFYSPENKEAPEPGILKKLRDKLIQMINSILKPAQKPTPQPPVTPEPMVEPNEVTPEEFRAQSVLFYGIPRPTGPKSCPDPKLLLNNDEKNIWFVTSYCESWKNPAWAAYSFGKVDSFETGPRPSKFKTDQRTTAKVTHDDYTHSGYDRGHMAPNLGVAVNYGDEAQNGTFLMSNIVPQSPSLNRGPWAALERIVVHNYSQNFGNIRVITGPVFSDNPEKMESGVPIPLGTFKILAQEQQGEIKLLGFFLPQTVDRKDDFANFIVSVREIEEMTDLDFFHELPDSQENLLENKIPALIW